MKHLLHILLVLASTGAVFGQKVKFRIPTHEDDSIATANDQCLHRNLYSAEKRLGFYPFKKAKRVVLISFDDPEQMENTIPVADKSIDYSKVLEKRELTRTLTDSLTDILYNVGYTSTDYWLRKADPGASCYNPRNGILFLDEKNRLQEYIEICFECGKSELSSKRIRFGDLCEQKYELLRRFFADAGIKTGVSPTHGNE